MQFIFRMNPSFGYHDSLAGKYTGLYGQTSCSSCSAGTASLSENYSILLKVSPHIRNISEQHRIVDMRVLPHRFISFLILRKVVLKFLVSIGCKGNTNLTLDKPAVAAAAQVIQCTARLLRNCCYGWPPLINRQIQLGDWVH